MIRLDRGSRGAPTGIGPRTLLNIELLDAVKRWNTPHSST